MATPRLRRPRVRFASKEQRAKAFFCINATKVYLADKLHYLFIHSDDASEPRHVALIAAALRGYLHVARVTGFHTSLIIMAPRIDVWARPKSVEDYRQSYWRMYKRLRKFHYKARPKHINEDTSSKQWSWCFEGNPPFMAVMTPAHEKRRSGHAPIFCISYQPKRINLIQHPEEAWGSFEESGGSGWRDETAISLDVTHNGEHGSSDARQLFPLDGNVSSPCPHPFVSSLDLGRAWSLNGQSIIIRINLWSGYFGGDDDGNIRMYIW